MTLPKRGRRSIDVDGTVYHYVVAYHRSERAVIRRADNSGKSLFVFPFAILKPSNVADAIREARKHDWESRENTSDCWLVFDSDEEGNSHFEFLPLDDYRVVTYPTKGKLPEGTDAAGYDDIRPWYLRTRPSTGR